MQKVFISYHHENDQYYKEVMMVNNKIFPSFIDCSVSTGDINESLDDGAIRVKIRDEYLSDSTVTIVLVGKETKRRKHVDWEIYSSMYNGSVNKQSGILVVNLPTISNGYFRAAHGEEEKNKLYPEEKNWITFDQRTQLEERYPFMPDRVVDNLVTNNGYISVVNWEKIYNDWAILKYLIELTHDDRAKATYDLSRPMRRANS